MSYETVTRFFVKITLLSAALLPLVYFNRILHVPFTIFILGTGSWGIGLIFKIPAHQLVVVPLQNKTESSLTVSALNGLLSGIFELGAALLIILLMKNKVIFDFNAVIAFGLVIGSFEMLLIVFSKDNDLLKGTALEKPSEQLTSFLGRLEGLRYFVFNGLFPLAERILATLLHIATRGMVFVTLLSGNIFPFILALLVFLLADGLLTYFYYITGRLAGLKGLGELFLYLFILTAVSFVSFLYLIAPYKETAL